MTFIFTRIREHSRRAFIVSAWSKRPPGYNEDAWAIVLMDSDYKELKEDFNFLVASKKKEAQIKDPLFGEVDYPDLPEHPSHQFLVKVREIYISMLRDRYQEACDAALQLAPKGQVRQATALREASLKVKEACRIVEMVEGQNPFKVTVSMRPDGEFQAKLKLDPSKVHDFTEPSLW